MDITVTKADLHQALSVAQSIVEKKATMPILANVLLSAGEGKIKVSATDLEVTAVISCKADIRSAGSTTVSARVFSDIVRELPEGEITIKLTDGERLEISANKSRLKMIGVSAEEYPSLPGVSTDVKGKVPAAQLLEMINKTIYAVSSDETRFNLNGVCFDIPDGKAGKGKGLNLIATDGHRLSMISRPLPNIGLSSKVIVPRKGLLELKKLLEVSGDSALGIEFGDGFLVAETSDTKLSMRLVDGEFPDYTQVLPKGKGVKATISTEELSQALRRVALMVTDKGKCVKMDFSSGRIRISSQSPELGEASEEITCQYAGEPLSIGFNAKYLIDFCASLGEAQNLVIELHGELGPGKLSPENDDGYVAIVMPMRLS